MQHLYLSSRTRHPQGRSLCDLLVNQKPAQLTALQTKLELGSSDSISYTILILCYVYVLTQTQFNLQSSKGHLLFGDKKTRQQNQDKA